MKTDDVPRESASLPMLAPVEPDSDGELLSVVFGVYGNSQRFRGAGWCEPEARFTWTSGLESDIELPRPEIPGHYALDLHVSPFVWKEKQSYQRLFVLVNGDEVLSDVVEEATVLRCEVPWALLARDPVARVSFLLPDAAKPVETNGVPDSRTLALAFSEINLIRIGDEHDEFEPRALMRSGPTTARPVAAKSSERSACPATGSDQKALMMQFESLGENCEFGLVQRKCGAEPLGLLRFSSSPLPKLISALNAKFEGLGHPDLIKVELSANGREYMVADKRFGLYYHAWVMAGEKSPEEIHRRECSRLPYLSNKLVEDLRANEKIFVYQPGSGSYSGDQTLLLKTAITSYAPVTLLWVGLADKDHPSGSVEEVAPGLLRGHVDRLAPPANAHDLSLHAWVEVCKNARLIWEMRS